MVKDTDFSVVRRAVEANNYASLPDTTKAKITETRFADMVAKNADRAVVEKAFESGDYVAFKNAMIAQIPDEAVFQKKVSMHKARYEAQSKIETAVKNKDFAAFKSVMESQRAEMEVNRLSGVSVPKIDDAQVQKRFDSLVEYYVENGQLPETKGFGKMGGGRMGHGK
jgi:hypothetical protein